MTPAAARRPQPCHHGAARAGAPRPPPIRCRWPALHRRRPLRLPGGRRRRAVCLRAGYQRRAPLSQPPPRRHLHRLCRGLLMTASGSKSKTTAASGKSTRTATAGHTAWTSSANSPPTTAADGSPLTGSRRQRSVHGGQSPRRRKEPGRNPAALHSRIARPEPGDTGRPHSRRRHRLHHRKPPACRPPARPPARQHGQRDPPTHQAIHSRRLNHPGRPYHPNAPIMLIVRPELGQRQSALPSSTTALSGCESGWSGHSGQVAAGPARPVPQFPIPAHLRPPAQPALRPTGPGRSIHQCRYRQHPRERYRKFRLLRRPGKPLPE